MAARGRDNHTDSDAVSDFTPRGAVVIDLDRFPPARSVDFSFNGNLSVRNALTESEFGHWLEMAGQDDTFA